jgi:polyphosphate kinase 2 (PPK2 family)
MLPRTVVLVEGRDGAGKTTLVRRIAASAGDDARILVMPRPTDDDLRGDTFGRWLAELQRSPRVVVCDRSWYSRATIERVMGFCTSRELERFWNAVPQVEATLVRAGVRLVKIYLDVSDEEQAKRILRRKTPTAIDVAALARPGEHVRAAEEMLRRTSTSFAPWHVVSGGGSGGAERESRTPWRAIEESSWSDFESSTTEAGSSASRS